MSDFDLGHFEGEAAPVVEAPVEVVEVVAEPEPAVEGVAVEVAEIPVSAVRFTADGVCLSRVERSPEGVITKVLEV
jgi:hypothetical protein